jgi:DNA (cytosine-5)-methyltransferase 1
MIKVLNAYAGIGGNRKLWKGVKVTAVEKDPEIADIYSKFFPEDEMVIGDAHSYLLENFRKFDFIWTSPPCQTHSRIAKATYENKNKHPKYPEMSLYQQIILLRQFFAGGWLVENVIPYYKPLIAPSFQGGRHYFWSNFVVRGLNEPKWPINPLKDQTTTALKVMMKWIGLEIDFRPKRKHPCQLWNNCVHPLIGKQILDQWISMHKVRTGLKDGFGLGSTHACNDRRI